MARRQRISAPAPIAHGPEDVWFNQVTAALNALPHLSIISTSNGPNSTITSEAFALAFDVGSSATHLWFKFSGSTTTGWKAVTLT